MIIVSKSHKRCNLFARLRVFNLIESHEKTEPKKIRPFSSLLQLKRKIINKNEDTINIPGA